MSSSRIDPANLDFHLAPPQGYLFDLQKGKASDANWMLESTPASDLSPWQGDVIESGSMVWMGEEGQPVRWEGPIVLTSHGCDTEPMQEAAATVAPAAELEAYLDALVRRADKPERDAHQYRDSLRGALIAQSIRNTFYYPPVFGMPARVVDFGFVGSVETRWLVDLVAGAGTNRLRLTENGHRLFTCKLAAHFARGEKRIDYPRKMVQRSGLSAD